jgi:hypothetical protein
LYKILSANQHINNRHIVHNNNSTFGCKQIKYSCDNKGSCCTLSHISKVNNLNDTNNLAETNNLSEVEDIKNSKNKKKITVEF